MPRKFTQDQQYDIGEALVEAAREALPKTGFRRTSIDELVRAAGIGKGSFYQFFQSKAELWGEVLQRSEDDWHDGLQALVKDESKTPEERLYAVVRRIFEEPMADALVALYREPEDLAWWRRSTPIELPEDVLEAEDMFLVDLWDRLRLAGAVTEEAVPAGFVGLPRLAMAMQLGRERVDNPSAEYAVDWLVDAVVDQMGS